jgi:uncharacterized membrane protein
MDLRADHASDGRIGGLDKMIQQPVAIMAVLLGAIYFSIWITGRFPWAERLSTVLWIIFTGALVSNLGLVPTDAPIYGSIVGFTVPFAVCVILFTVRLGDVRDAGTPVLVAFFLACVGTALGVVLASLSMEPLLGQILGDDSWKLAGPYTGTFIGGSLNFFALWTGLEIGNPDLLAAANAVDNLTLFPLYALWMVIPAWLIGKYAPAPQWTVEEKGVGGSEEQTKEKPPLDPGQVAALAFLAVLVMAVSEWLKISVVDRFAPAVPTILIVTTLALILAQVGPIRRLKGAWEIGDLAFYLFFAAVGAMINFYQAVVLSPALFLFVAIIMGVHFVTVYGVGRFFKMDVSVLTIASVAAKTGLSMVVPIAETKGWRHLVLPGIIVAMLGYALGNYAGWGVATAIRIILGG